MTIEVFLAAFLVEFARRLPEFYAAWVAAGSVPPEDLNWEALMPTPRADLERQVDLELDASQETP